MPIFFLKILPLYLIFEKYLKHDEKKNPHTSPLKMIIYCEQNTYVKRSFSERRSLKGLYANNDYS